MRLPSHSSLTLKKSLTWLRCNLRCTMHYSRTQATLVRKVIESADQTRVRSEVRPLNLPSAPVRPQPIKLYQLYTEPFDLSVMKLLILHVSEHRDEPCSTQRTGYSKTVRRTLFDKFADLTPPSALEKDADAQTHADHVIASVIPLGKRFYPSESAFPLRESEFLQLFHNGHNGHLLFRLYSDVARFFLVAKQGTPSERLDTLSFDPMWYATCRDMGHFA